jgi:hypothetical protein
MSEYLEQAYGADGQSKSPPSDIFIGKRGVGICFTGIPMPHTSGNAQLDHICEYITN